MKLGDVKHDIKRNLSAINAGIEMLKRNKNISSDHCQKIIDEMAGQSEQTIELVRTLFSDFRIDEKKGGE